MNLISAVLTLIIAAAPNPCNERESIKKNRLFDRPHINDETRKTLSPVIYTLRYPITSPSEAKGSSIDIIII
ncbi:hypothetical protein NUKP16_15220 [Klebsiella quasipneumoniae]|nr:hypothetical protein NUKP16_15220 [Klebsiella quasipneumoniae]GKQ02020.1 hypothetical protein NUKP771_05990 [Klebsiella quasipneumoniae]